MIEVWKTITHCPKYSISSLGRVRNNKTERILKNNSATNLYLHVQICGKTNYIHNLVTTHFLGAKPKDKVVDHIDGHRENNELSNLCYVTQSINLMGERNKTDTKVMTIRLPYKLWKQLKYMIADEKIKSIHAAILKGLDMLLKSR